MKDAKDCDEELLRKLDSAASPEVSGMLNRYFVAALCESAAARLRFKDAAIDNLAAEVERLREECDFWRSHLHIDSPKMDGQHTWRLMWNHFTLVGSDAGEVVRNALEAIRSQPLPAPPDK